MFVTIGYQLTLQKIRLTMFNTTCTWGHAITSVFTHWQDTLGWHSLHWPNFSMMNLFVAKLTRRYAALGGLESVSPATLYGVKVWVLA